MASEPGIYRNELPTDGKFTTVANDWIRDTGLTPQANMLWIYLLSHKVGYELRDSQILRETGFGRKGLRASRNELVEKGWLVLERIKNADGSLGTYRYYLEPSRDPMGTVARGTVEQGTVAEGSDLRKLIPKNTNSKKTTKGEPPKRPHRLPEDWTPSDRLMEMFTSKWPNLDPDYEVENFINYWLGAGKPKADWDRTFQGWMNRNQRDNAQKPQVGRKLSNAERAALLVRDMELKAQRGAQAPLEVESGLDTSSWLGRDEK